MPFKFNFLNPRSQNSTQRVGMIVTIGMLIGLFAMHNPFGGYHTTTATLYKGDFKSYILSLTPTDIPFLDWISKGAFFKSVSHIKDLIGFSFVILVFGISWLWIFQDRIDKDSNKIDVPDNDTMKKT